jgi:hypothetical protein
MVSGERNHRKSDNDRKASYGHHRWITLKGIKRFHAITANLIAQLNKA